MVKDFFKIEKILIWIGVKFFKMKIGIEIGINKMY